MSAPKVAPQTSAAASRATTAHDGTLGAPVLPSQPTFCSFQPVIPYQRQVCDLVRDWDYATGNLEILLSGSFGSAKSTLMAHLGVRHVVENAGARLCLARRALPDLKRTIWREVLDHIAEDFKEGRSKRDFKRGADYFINRSTMTITFRNGSEIICASWADGRYKRFRSLKLSMLIFEEIVENETPDEEAFKQLKARLRRLPHVSENLLIAATNPDSPSHWVHKYFIDPQAAHTADPQLRDGPEMVRGTYGGCHPTRRVFYSNTRENPFLDPTYVTQLERDLPPREADRYIRGLWVEISTERIYYEYVSAVQYKATIAYVLNPRLPIHLTFDFNIGDGKPMSCAMFQFVDGAFHVFAEAVIEGARTADLMEDLGGRGLLVKDHKYVINGDAAGKHRDTRSSRSDYDIIMQDLRNRGINFEYNVPLANPPIRTRHNRVNAFCKNDNGEVRLFIYKGCKVCDEGMRLTALKKGAGYVEDDSKAFQHVTTAIGYGIVATHMKQASKPQGTVQL